jgi:hypothetical protein
MLRFFEFLPPSTVKGFLKLKMGPGLWVTPDLPAAIFVIIRDIEKRVAPLGAPG